MGGGVAGRRARAYDTGMVAFDTLKASRRLRDAVVSWCATMSWRQVTLVIIALTAVQLAAIGIFAAIIISRL